MVPVHFGPPHTGILPLSRNTACGLGSQHAQGLRVGSPNEVKIGTKIYSPSLADPLEKQDIFDQTKEFYKILENTHINSPDEIHIVTLMDILDDVK